jgi:plasmid stabilization system protein ParE
MTFAITWSEAAIQDLAAIWLHVSARTALNNAANEIDRLLARNPQHQGESRPGNERVIYVGPLGVRYDVVVDDLRVTVGAVWLIRAV